MEKDIKRIPKNAETDIVIRVDDYGGKVGVTIREFVKSDRYTGFTKAGTRIPAEQFAEFREALNSITDEDLMLGEHAAEGNAEKEQQTLEKNSASEESDDGSAQAEDIDEQAI
ncbi:hypothetical protein D6817_05470 [Candidatus Pacearchaeota archaeon]|nr:MAG: hypothetical protein D6817_05470 [Candidatus Pacearchaeota archaeon]